MNYSELYCRIIVMIVEMCPVLHKFNFSVFDGDVPCPTSVPLLRVWWRCALSYISSIYPCLMKMSLSYISSTSQCLMEVCPVLHKFNFSVFNEDVHCPTSVSLLIVWWRCALSYISKTSPCLMKVCPVLHQFNFSVFDGDVPSPTQVLLLSVWWRCALSSISYTSHWLMVSV